MYHIFTLVHADRPAIFEERSYANLLVVTGPPRAISDFIDLWCSDGSLTVSHVSKQGAAALETFDEDDFVRSELVHQDVQAAGIYFESYGGVALRLCAEIANRGADLKGLLLASDHVASDGIVGKLLEGRFEYMTVPPSSRVDSILKAYRSLQLPPLICKAAVSMLPEIESLHWERLPDALWDFVWRRIGGRKPHVSLLIDQWAMFEYYSLDAEDRGCELADILSDYNREWLMHNPHLKSSIGAQCLLEFVIFAWEGIITTDRSEVLDALKRMRSEGSRDDLIRATLAGYIKGIVSEDPVGCAVEYWMMIWQDLAAYVSRAEWPSTAADADCFAIGPDLVDHFAP